MARWESDNDPQGGGNARFWMLVVLALVVVVVVALLAGKAAGVDPVRIVYMTGALVLAVFVGGSMLRDNPWSALGQLAIWVGIGALIALGYTYRAELGFGPEPATETAELRHLPQTPSGAIKTTTGPRSVTLYAQGGHFFAQAEVGGKMLTFMVDTGATVVALSRDDARALGITPAQSDFTEAIDTANGVTRGARVTLDSVGIGPIDMRDVEAMVVDGDMRGSLLGMSFLNRLAGYQVTGDKLVLTQ